MSFCSIIKLRQHMKNITAYLCRFIRNVFLNGSLYLGAIFIQRVYYCRSKHDSFQYFHFAKQHNILQFNYMFIMYFHNRSKNTANENNPLNDDIKVKKLNMFNDNTYDKQNKIRNVLTIFVKKKTDIIISIIQRNS